MFFNADWRAFEFDEDEMKKNAGFFVLKESEETEKKGGGMGRSDIGVFGIVPGDFPPEVEEEIAANKAQVDDEATKQNPSA